MNIPEFEPYLDFWLDGQRQGFAGHLPRIKLSDGSKMVVLPKDNLVYIDRWYGSDLGGGQTLLYEVIEPWNIDKPTEIEGVAKARLGYSGEIVRRFTEEEMKNLVGVFGKTMSQSDIIWRVLKSALSKVNKERPLRGPGQFTFREFPAFQYNSEEKDLGDNRLVGEENIFFQGSPCFVGNYDFTLIKKNLEDRL